MNNEKEKIEHKELMYLSHEHIEHVLQWYTDIKTALNLKDSSNIF